MSGATALYISKHRPSTLIFGLSPDKHALSRMALYWGVYPVETKIYTSINEMIDKEKDLLVKKKLLSKGDKIVIVSGTNPTPGGSSLIRIDLL